MISTKMVIFVQSRDQKFMKRILEIMNFEKIGCFGSKPGGKDLFKMTLFHVKWIIFEKNLENNFMKLKMPYIEK